jgi:hypothetical protein
MKSTKDMTDHEWVQSREFLRDQAERRCAAAPASPCRGKASDGALANHIALILGECR